MKISPLASPASTVGASPEAPVQTLRTLRMNTNATPGRPDAQLEELPPAQAAPEPALAISDANSQADASEATKPLSPQIVALRKAQRAVQVKEAALKAREEALKTASPAQGADILARLKAEPLKVFKEANLSYEEITNAILENSDGGMDAEALKAEITKLVESKLSDSETRAEKAALAEMGREATRLAAEGDTYELVRATGSVPKVTELIERIYREEGTVLSVPEAMQFVEDELIAEGLKMAGIKKVQSRLAPQAPAPQPAPQPQRPAMRTLTNRDTAQVPMSRKARALAAFNGTLNKGA